MQAGGTVELRLGAVEGPLLGNASIEVNGAWESFYEKTIELNREDRRNDLFIVFQNPVNRGGLMNVDSITFHP